MPGTVGTSEQDRGTSIRGGLQALICRVMIGMVLPTYGRYLHAFFTEVKQEGTFFKIALTGTGTILTVFLFSPGPDPAFQAIPDPRIHP